MSAIGTDGQARRSPTRRPLLHRPRSATKLRTRPSTAPSPSALVQRSRTRSRHAVHDACADEGGSLRRPATASSVSSTALLAQVKKLQQTLALQARTPHREAIEQAQREHGVAPMVPAAVRRGLVLSRQPDPVADDIHAPTSCAQDFALTGTSVRKGARRSRSTVRCVVACVNAPSTAADRRAPAVSSQLGASLCPPWRMQAETPGRR